ncbi:Appr-1-p processing protein [Rhodopseudomonas sp. AAP120]|uniref:type II toxin-antitoxin system antitoxin DNA ADP-ribosyl glycohydrolase DarG n=1 Tax=Rhodopseudomonas sp. AAP120 TaxID=1523430 RepID=UPI0006B926BF|nr:macro domain-containing protein [Rhodopseudomonas sp. AAP120]KPG00029.1 Appr-1-p processing protein [Rhodopseudomonas sp. AAP120]
MITFTEGNLLKADAEALVNTVNTVGVMGKGIALMFKEAFPENFRAYSVACKAHQIKVGQIFATERKDLIGGPKWIINFPTKQHWRNPSKIEWIKDGLNDLVRFIREHEIKSIALPPLGSGNGGLDWKSVRPLIESAMGDLDVQIIVYEPTARYQNVAKPSGVEKLTSARALVAELVRRYSVLGFECTLLEIQKLAYLLQRQIVLAGLASPLRLDFKADKYGPYAPTLGHLLNSLDGSYLHCEKRVADASILDTIWFEGTKKDVVGTYLRATEAKQFIGALDRTTALIDGFEYPLGMELLATVDWLLSHDKVEPNLEAVKLGLKKWLGGGEASQRKLRLFEDSMIELALARFKN